MARGGHAFFRSGHTWFSFLPNRTVRVFVGLVVSFLFLGLRWTRGEPLGTGGSGTTEPLRHLDQ